MKRALILIAIGVFCFSMIQCSHVALATSGPPVVEWSKRYSGATAYAPIVIQTSDGGYALASTGDFGSGKVWCLVKTDSTGTVEWKKTYAGIPPNIAESLIQTSDGGYAIAGVTNHNPYGNAWLVKTDSNGNMQWNQIYSDGSWTGVWSLVQTTDNGYVMSGNKDYYTGWLIKTDSSGTKQWSQGFGVGNNTQLTSVVQTSDGGYVATGATQFPRFSGKVDAYLVKTDSDGNTVWIKDFSRTTGDDFGRSVIQTSDGGYAIVGETDHWGNADFWLIKTDASGNYLWDKTFGGTGWDGATSIVQTTDGGYALAGQTNSFGAGGNDFWLVKTYADGTMQWNSTYGGAGDDVGTSVVQTSDGGYALAGYTDSFSGDGSYEVWLIKLAGPPPVLYQLTVTSTPITGIPFTINTTSKTTPYTDSLSEDYYTIEMPQTYNGYKWSHWLEDGNTNRVKTVYLQGTTTLTGVYVAITTPPPSVGGEWSPITMQTLTPANRRQMLALWISLISLVTLLATSFVYIRRKRRQN